MIWPMWAISNKYGHYLYYRDNLEFDNDEWEWYVLQQFSRMEKSYIEVPKNQEAQDGLIKFRYRLSRHNYQWDLPEYIG